MIHPTPSSSPGDSEEDYIPSANETDNLLLELVMRMTIEMKVYLNSILTPVIVEQILSHI